MPLASHSTFAHQSGRFYALDALRGIAAVQVVVGHMFGFPPLMAANFVLAVDFFFCLSGFVIAFAYEQRLLTGMRVRDFLLARLVRLYPLYLLGTVFGIVRVLHDPAFSGLLHLQQGHFLRALVPALFLLPSRAFYMTVDLYPFNGPAWSLLAEVLVNFAYAIVLLRFRLSSWALAGTALLALLMLVVFPGNSHTLATGADWSTMRDGVARAFLSFPLGVLLYRAHRSAAPAPRLSSAGAIAGLGLLTVVILLCIYLPLAAIRHREGQLCLVVVVFPLLIWLGARLHVSLALRVWCATAGELSYALYILHFPLIGLWEESGFTTALRQPLLNYAFAAGCIAFLIVFSWGAAVLYDAPVRAFLQRRLRRRGWVGLPPHEATPRPVEAI